MPRALPPFALAVLACATLACAGSDVPAASPALAVEGRFSRVTVSVTEGGTQPFGPDAASRTAATVRQSARDWLEHEDRLAFEGELELEVDVDAAHLRGALTTWLFAALVPPDYLAATVSVRREGALAARYPVRVESALAGYGWRDREERLDRLARRLGQRVAESL
jgi:hypothetical protein